MNQQHQWKVRLIVALVMLVLAFIGIIFANVFSTGAWGYWKTIIPIYAVIALWLSWFMRRDQTVIKPITIWHEVLHWVGLFGAILLVELYVESGLLSRTLASLFALTLLSLTVFTIGIYVESTFILIGIVLALFAVVVAVAIEYLYAFTIPALLIGIGVIVYMIWYSHQKSSSS